jgi:hypothetical protein
MFRKVLIALAVSGLATGLVGLCILPSSAQPPSGIVTSGGRVVAEGSVVRLEYTMRGDAGAVLDGSTEAEPSRSSSRRASIRSSWGSSAPWSEWVSGRRSG